MRTPDWDPRTPEFNIEWSECRSVPQVAMEEILHHPLGANIEFGGKGVRCMLRVHSLACFASGAGFLPSTVSDLCFSPDALGETDDVDFGCWALFRNLVKSNVSQSTSAQAICRRVLVLSSSSCFY